VSAGGGGDGDAAARSSSVRGGVDGVGASEASNGVASGASEASGGGDAARGCLGRRGAIGASLSSAVSRQISGLGSRARVWIGFRASEASRGRLKASDGSNVDGGSPLLGRQPDGGASSSARAAGAPSARFDMMMQSQEPGSSLRGSGLASRPSAVTDASARLLGQHNAHAAGEESLKRGECGKIESMWEMAEQIPGLFEDRTPPKEGFEE